MNIEKERENRRKNDLELIEKMTKKYGFDVMDIVSESENYLNSLIWDEDKINHILKPCPFCGSYAEIDKLQDVETDIISYIIICSECGIQTDEGDNPAEVVSVWNKRI